MKGCLLLAEDDPDDVELTVRSLRSHGFEGEVHVARDGSEALEFLYDAYARARPLPAAVLLDLKMPKLDGIEVLRRMREDPRLKDIPVAVFTSSGREEERRAALALGARHFLQKPTDLRGYAAIAQAAASLMREALRA